MAWKDFLKYIFLEFDSTWRMRRCSIGCTKNSGVVKNGSKMAQKPRVRAFFWPFLTTSGMFAHPIEHLPILLALWNSGKMYFRKSFLAPEILVIFWSKLFPFLIFLNFFLKKKFFFEFFFNLTNHLHKELNFQNFIQKKFKKIKNGKSFDQKIAKTSGARKDFLKYICLEFHSARRMGRCSIGCTNIPIVVKNGQKTALTLGFFGHFRPIFDHTRIFCAPNWTPSHPSSTVKFRENVL